VREETLAEHAGFGITIPGPLAAMRGVKQGKLKVTSAGYL
jgi:hypothetical protein